MFCSNCGNEIPAGSTFCSRCGQMTASAYKVATPGQRFVHYIVDNIVSNAVFGLVVYFIAATPGDPIPAYWNWMLYLIFVYPGYFIITEFFWHKTPAKFLTKTKVVTLDGYEPDFSHIFWRAIVRIIPFEPISFLFGSGWWHDTLTKTMVVPDEYTPEQVQQIIPVSHKRSLVAIILVGTLVLFAIIVAGLAILGYLSEDRGTTSTTQMEYESRQRDATRLNDIRAIATALELYYNDHGEYPEQQNASTYIPDLSTYIEPMRTAPTPADGFCSTRDNAYNYSSDGRDYVLEFCLGEEIADLEPGYHIMTPYGYDPGDNEEETFTFPPT